MAVTRVIVRLQGPYFPNVDFGVLTCPRKLVWAFVEVPEWAR